MRLLKTDNTSFLMNSLPEQIDDLRYCILDYSSPKDLVDFFWLPLIFLDQFARPSADLSLGKYRIQMPLDWSIVISDKNSGAVEIIELRHINDRPFTAFVMNPINGFMPSFEEITIENIFPDITWTMPKLKYGHILAIPLTSDTSPPCAFFVKDVNRLPEELDLTKIF